RWPPYRLAGPLLAVCCAGCTAEPLKTASSADTALAEGDETGTAPVVDADGDGTPASADCNDTDPAVFPGAEEVCNGIDDNCDGAIDEGVRQTFYNDVDTDGYGNPDLPVDACTAPSGTVSVTGDCNDTDEAIHPNAEEVCNDLDDDCDGDIDEDIDQTVYADLDGDGWGDETAAATGCPEPGWATASGDCNDDDPGVHPGVPFDACDGEDTDCDGDVDEDSKAGWSLLSVDTSAGSVFEIDPSTAVTTAIASVSTDIKINTMDVSENGQSVVHVNSINRLAIFDACAGSWTDIGAHGVDGIGGLGFGPSGRLFGIGSADVLYEFDTTTGAGSVVGPLGIDVGTSGLAWDCTTQTMYGADGNGDRVFEIDLSTGAATNVRSTTVPFASVGLEFDRSSGLLFGATGSALYTIEPATGRSTYIGPLAASNIDDLAWHPPCP
ncbi:MAG TPA: hypothetical protein DFR83_07590, partial [Deltaproteobacteria bacterium]|nr:hypothetical protein [Deltaproteobacteria bacterium]